jgi:hypothetical protein
LRKAQDKADARLLKKQRKDDQKREEEERVHIERDRAAEVAQREIALEAARLSDEQAAQLLDEQAAEKLAAKALKKQQKRGIMVAKGVKRKRDQVILEYAKTLAEKRAKEEVDRNSKGFKKSARKNLLAAGLSSNFRKKKGSILRTVPSSWTAQPPRAI